MAHFHNFLDARQVDWREGRPLWMTLVPLYYTSDLLGDAVIIPAEFITDLASVPRFLLTWVLSGGRAPRPAIVHDYACQTGTLPLQRGGIVPITRRCADAVFYEAMRADPLDGTEAAGAWAMWVGVRIGGWHIWRRRETRKRVLNPIWSSTSWPRPSPGSQAAPETP